MSVADDLAIIARRFYALARKASDPVTKLHLICLADSYVSQALELRNTASDHLSAAQDQCHLQPAATSHWDRSPPATPD